MNTMQRIRIHSVTLFIATIAVMAVLAGCDRAEQIDDPADSQPQSPAGQPADGQRPLEHVVEFDGYTLRANVSPTDVLPGDMAREYGIEPEPDLVLLNLVILKNQPDRQPTPVSGEVSAQHESLIGHVETIDMRAVETDGHVSYIGTLDASGQRLFQLVIEAQPAGIDQPLQMNFEVQLEAVDPSAR
jgi:hypothetical protein